MAILTLKQLDAVAQLNTVGLACYSVQTYPGQQPKSIVPQVGDHIQMTLVPYTAGFPNLCPREEETGPLFQTHFQA